MGACFHIEGVTCDNCRAYRQGPYYPTPVETGKIVFLPNTDQIERLEKLVERMERLHRKLEKKAAKKPTGKKRRRT